MRKLLITLMLAGVAATPAIATPQNWSDRQQAREDRQSAHEERVQMREEQQQARSEERSQRQSEVRQQVMERSRFNGGNAYDAQRNAYDAQRNAYAAQRNAYAAQRNAYAGQRDGYAQQRQEYANQRRQNWRDGRDFRQSDQRNAEAMRDHRWHGSDQAWRTQDRRASSIRWDRDWRNDHRYDWRRYRDHHRSRFHLGFYIDPFGWGYEPFSIGYRIRPNYYGNQFWIDPGLYGLPYPPPGAVWVRYWNDAVLVDTYSGTVIDVIPGFFW